MTREKRRQAIMLTREWFAAVVENAEPLVSGFFDDLTDEQHELVHTEQKRIAERIARTAGP